ncbi:helitron_like_N domain-containing protein [Trichonephila clavata]|uniref:Helitron_like_N domain-containing protein n=1 Tax=Trichonephila clavata TaxID=2740835 RepID=A0A8X6HJ94_TRICU|nr:helitron_like_N domain-containing protein [Trichonephila clavata]
MAVIGIGAENSNDEVTQYKWAAMSVVMKQFANISFPIHERHPSVVHLAVHLENGQRVYFTAQNAVQDCSATIYYINQFFETCQNDDFAQTLLYSEMQNIIPGINPQGDLYDETRKPVPDIQMYIPPMRLAGFIQYNPSNDNVFIYDCY